jgi:hypothetical protein
MSARVLRYRQTMLRLLHVTEAPGFELLIQFFGDALHLEAVKFELVRNFLRLELDDKGQRLLRLCSGVDTIVLDGFEVVLLRGVPNLRRSGDVRLKRRCLQRVIDQRMAAGAGLAG